VSERNPYNQRNDGGWCECSVCHRTFGGLRGFDRHKVTTTGQPGYDTEHDFRCATDDELRDRGYLPDHRGWWRSAEPRPARLGSTRTAAAG
jgi:hypothetical protein